MIDSDFNYYGVENVNELPGLLNDIKKTKYGFYAGGTEIITMLRGRSIALENVIDIKGIPECKELFHKDGKFIIGAAVTLNEIVENGDFPLLATAVSRIADHTNQCKITIGGNICGRIIYKEAILPLLVTDAHVTLFRNGEYEVVPINDIFDKTLKIGKEDLIVNFMVADKYLDKKYVHVKKTKMEKIDYPLVTVVAINNDNKIKIAFSGLCSYPFRDIKVEEIINDRSKSIEDRVRNAINELAQKEILNDLIASRDYRLLITRRAIKETISVLEGER